MTDNFSQALQTLVGKVLGINVAAKELEGTFNRVKLLVAGLGGVFVARLRTHRQNMTVAARQMAEKKTVGHLS